MHPVLYEHVHLYILHIILLLYFYIYSRTIPNDDCSVQFFSSNSQTTNQVITVVTSIAAFYLPVTVMMILYFKIYLETQRRQKDLHNLQGKGEKKYLTKRYLVNLAMT